MNLYDRQKAVDYAHTWWNRRNPQFYDFENLGGDCTNFISQCLLYGGLEMRPEWPYYNLLNRTPSWTGVNEFYAFLTNSNNHEPLAKTINEQDVELGDIVQLVLLGPYFHHTAIITKILGNEPKLENICVTCHTLDAIDKPLMSYRILKYRFLKILV